MIGGLLSLAAFSAHQLFLAGFVLCDDQQQCGELIEALVASGANLHGVNLSCLMKAMATRGSGLCAADLFVHLELLIGRGADFSGAELLGLDLTNVDVTHFGG